MISSVAQPTAKDELSTTNSSSSILHPLLPLALHFVWNGRFTQSICSISMDPFGLWSYIRSKATHKFSCGRSNLSGNIFPNRHFVPTISEYFYKSYVRIFAPTSDSHFRHAESDASQQQPATMTMANGQNGQPHRIGSMTDAIDLPRPPLKSQTTLHNLISID